MISLVPYLVRRLYLHAHTTNLLISVDIYRIFVTPFGSNELHDGGQSKHVRRSRLHAVAWILPVYLSLANGSSKFSINLLSLRLYEKNFFDGKGCVSGNSRLE